MHFIHKIMSMENQPPTPAVNPLVRWFIVGLPLGLLIMGALSFIFYFQKKKAREHPPSSRYAEMLRKDVNLEDYRRHLSVFNQTIGPRASDKHENVEAAESYIKSTLGFDNMGYQVLRREFEMNGKSYSHIMVELTGKKSPDHVVLVTARYDGEKSEDIAALLIFAHAFTGTAHGNTIRFVAVYGEDESYRETPATVTEFNLSGPAVDAPDAIEQLRVAEKKISALSDAADW